MTQIYYFKSEKQYTLRAMCITIRNVHYNKHLLREKHPVRYSAEILPSPGASASLAYIVRTRRRWLAAQPWNIYLAGSCLREFSWASRLVITVVVIGPETAVALVQLRSPAIFRPVPLKSGRDFPRHIRHLLRRLLRKNGDHPRNSPGGRPARHCASWYLPDLTDAGFIDGKLNAMLPSRMGESLSVERNGIRLVEEKLAAPAGGNNIFVCI